MITLRKGDSRTLTIGDMLQPDGTTPYELVATDVVRFTVRAQNGTAALISKQSGGSGITFNVGDDFATVTLSASDTDLTAGTYRYDAEVTHIDGTKTTVDEGYCYITSDIT